MQKIFQGIQNIIKMRRNKEEIIDRPYFLKNPKWYIEFNEPQKLEGCIVKYVLTEKAPEKAKKSYCEYYGNFFVMNSYGKIMTEDPPPYMDMPY